MEEGEFTHARVDGLTDRADIGLDPVIAEADLTRLRHLYPELWPNLCIGIKVGICLVLVPGRKYKDPVTEIDLDQMETEQCDRQTDTESGRRISTALLTGSTTWLLVMSRVQSALGPALPTKFLPR